MNEMIAKLEWVESHMVELIKKKQWNSIFVDYNPPFVERVWTQLADRRVFLHKILPCDPEEALFHPHPWPSAVKILSGRYQMGIGYAGGSIAPPVAMTTILGPGSVYEMNDIDGWHYVAPLEEPVMSLMITGEPWGRTWVPKSDKHLEQLPREKINHILDFFHFNYIKTDAQGYK